MKVSQNPLPFGVKDAWLGYKGCPGYWLPDDTHTVMKSLSTGRRMHVKVHTLDAHSTGERNQRLAWEPAISTQIMVEWAINLILLLPRELPKAKIV